MTNFREVREENEKKSFIVKQIAYTSDVGLCSATDNQGGFD